MILSSLETSASFNKKPIDNQWVRENEEIIDSCDFSFDLEDVDLGPLSYDDHEEEIKKVMG